MPARLSRGGVDLLVLPGYARITPFDLACVATAFAIIAAWSLLHLAFSIGVGEVRFLDLVIGSVAAIPAALGLLLSPFAIRHAALSSRSVALLMLMPPTQFLVRVVVDLPVSRAFSSGVSVH